MERSNYKDKWGQWANDVEWMKRNDYEDKWSQQADHVGGVSNHKKKDKSREKKWIGANCNRYKSTEEI